MSPETTKTAPSPTGCAIPEHHSPPIQAEAHSLPWVICLLIAFVTPTPLIV